MDSPPTDSTDPIFSCRVSLSSDIELPESSIKSHPPWVGISSQAISENFGSKVVLHPGKFVNRRDVKRPAEIIEFVEVEDIFENSSITVAVRIRPFLHSEVQRNCKCNISMKGNDTIVKQDPISHSSLIFCYDYSFWSFEQLSSNYSCQEDIYRHLGQPLLYKALEGFNTCLFAYGQTGSGKSYSITGSKEDPGIIPRFCDELFSRIERLQLDTEDPVSFKVEISFYEVYKERIYDLLASEKNRRERTQLRVREHPVLGPYIEDLGTFVATGYLDVEHWLSLGNRLRATAATGMNDKSSRSHSCFMLMVTQNKIVNGEVASIVSKINIVDLAGSERVASSFTCMERLREGQSINKSLHTLGKVISLLSDNQISQRKNFIPYRDSVLTWLLKESLGGNSKTSMLATISPDIESSSETLSTLRYAQQARNIVNVAKINEDPKNRLIRELQAEIFRLRNLTQGVKSPGASHKMIQHLEEQLCAKERLMADTTRTWIDRLKLTEERKIEEIEELRKAGISIGVENCLPNLVNLNEDPQLSEMLIYVLKDGITSVGRKGANSAHDINLAGALVCDNHCTITNFDAVITINPLMDAATYLNGNLIVNPEILHHGDRLVIGGDHFFKFNHPIEVHNRISQTNTVQYVNDGFSFARNELISKQSMRIEIELENVRKEEREKMMQQLVVLKEAANTQLISQRNQYEMRIDTLSKTNTDYLHDQEIYIEAQNRLGELQARVEILEDENIAQRHLIQLGEYRKQKEDEEWKKYHTRLIEELEMEKNKLEGEISQARDASEKRKVVDYLPKTSGTELVRVSMMLQEANAIALHLSKNIVFTRGDFDSSDDAEYVTTMIRVYNKSNKTTTRWELDTFENRLETMRELYQGEFEDSMHMFPDIFNHPDDIWTSDLGLCTPGKSCNKLCVSNVKICNISHPKSLHLLPKVQSILPETLENICSPSNDDRDTISRFSNFVTNLTGDNIRDNLTSTHNIHSDMMSIQEHSPDYMVSTMNVQNTHQFLPQHVSTCIPTLTSIDQLGSVPKLCIERVDRLIHDIKEHRVTTSLEKFLTHSEYLLEFSRLYTILLYPESDSSDAFNNENDGLRYSAFNIFASFEMAVTHCSAASFFMIPGLYFEEICKEFVSMGLIIKQILFPTQPGSLVGANFLLTQVHARMNSVIYITSKSLLSQLVVYPIYTKRACKSQNNSSSQDLDLHAHLFFSHKGKLSNSISLGGFTYVRDISLQVLQSVSSSYRQSQELVKIAGNISLINPDVLHSIISLLKSIQYFISAVSSAFEDVENIQKQIVLLFGEFWCKFVWFLITLFSIETGVLRLAHNTRDAVEKHGDLDNIVSQANVIAFYSMSVTTSVEEIRQFGCEFLPSKSELTPLSKDVIRAAKALNRLAKKINGLPSNSFISRQLS